MILKTDGNTFSEYLNNNFSTVISSTNSANDPWVNYTGTFTTNSTGLVTIYLASSGNTTNYYKNFRMIGPINVAKVHVPLHTVSNNDTGTDLEIKVEWTNDNNTLSKRFYKGWNLNEVFDYHATS